MSDRKLLDAYESLDVGDTFMNKHGDQYNSVVKQESKITNIYNI